MGKLSYITSDPIADWNRYCEEEEKWTPEMVECDVCKEEFEKDGHRRICPKCREDINEEVKTIYENYMGWGVDETELINALYDAVDAL